MDKIFENEKYYINDVTSVIHSGDCKSLASENRMDYKLIVEGKSKSDALKLGKLYNRNAKLCPLCNK